MLTNVQQYTCRDQMDQNMFSFFVGLSCDVLCFRQVLTEDPSGIKIKRNLLWQPFCRNGVLTLIDYKFSILHYIVCLYFSVC